MRPLLLLPLALLLCAARAQAEAGIGGAALMGEPIGARPIALGSNYVSVSDDAFALYYNPAGLGLARRAEAATYAGLGLADTSLSAVLLGLPLGDWGGAGFGLVRQDNGSIELFQEDGTSQSRRAQQDLLISAGYGYSTVPTLDGPGRFSAGAGVKYYSSTLLEQAHAHAVALDLGGLWETPWRFTLGASVANLGPGVGYSGGGATGAKDPLPRALKLGASTMLGDWRIRQPVLLCAEFAKGVGNSTLGLGLEYVFAGMAALRLGYKFGDTAGAFTTGLGLTLGRLRFDYGLGMMSSVSDQHSISLAFQFGAPARRVSYADTRRQRDAVVSRYPAALFERGRFFEATSAIERDPSLPQAEQIKSRIKTAVDEALAMGPTPDAKRYSYAAAYRTRFGPKPYAAKAADLETALAHDPGNDELSAELAAARKQAAVETERSAKKSDALYAKAAKKYQAKRYASAIALLQQALQFNSSNQAAFRLLDLAIQASVNQPASDRALKEAPPAAKAESSAHFDLAKAEQLYIEGLSAYSLGDLKTTIRLWEDALRQNPFHERAKNGLEHVRRDDLQRSR